MFSGIWYGVDVNKEDISDNFEAFVWEPAVVKINAITAASEACCLVLSVDETVKNPKANMEAPPPGGIYAAETTCGWAGGRSLEMSTTPITDTFKQRTTVNNEYLRDQNADTSSQRFSTNNEPLQKTDTQKHKYFKTTDSYKQRTLPDNDT
eukprot:gene12070-2663_t